MSALVAFVIMIIGLFCRGASKIIIGGKGTELKYADTIDEKTLQDGAETAKKLYGASIKYKSAGQCNKYEFDKLGAINHRANIHAKSPEELFPENDRPRGITDINAIKYFMSGGNTLSPIMLVDHCGELVVVDGVHRLCATYLLDASIHYVIYDLVYTNADLLALEYPYIKYYKPQREIMKAFDRIKQYKLHIVSADFNVYNLPGMKLLYEGRPQLIETSPQDYTTMNYISDWFHECRLKCKRYDNPQSPLEYWAENKAEIIGNRNDLAPNQLAELSDIVYSKVIGCNNFRPGLMRGFIEKYKATSVLDISAGWGDRLIGAIAAGVKYTGVDPADCVHGGYQNIINTLAPVLPSRENKYVMIKSGFVECTLPTIDYDLVFSSPPYFDLEIYEPGPMQSIVKHPDMITWFDGFLAPSLQKAFAALITGGHMIININEVKNAGYIRKMLNLKMPGAKYLGAMGFADKIIRGKNTQYKSPQPLWIWRREYKCGLFINDRIIAATIDEVPGGYIRDTKFMPRSDHKYCGAVDKIHLSIVDILPPLNPDVTIEEHIINGKKLRVIMDNLLPGGTKQRAAEAFVKPGCEHIYAGSWNGFAQCALAIACRKMGALCTVFSARDDSVPAVRARSHWATIKVVHGGLKALQAAAEEYASKDTNRILLPFGFDAPIFRDRLEANLIAAIPEDIRDFTGTIWVAAGSGTLAAVLYNVFPAAKFALVQIGKKIWPDQLGPGANGTRAKLYIAEEPFYSDAELLPPWPSASNYDAKVYKFAHDYALPGDIIWNVAG